MRKGILFLALIYTYTLFGQESPKIKFGKIAVEDFSSQSYSTDTGAVAVVLYENGTTQVVGNKKGGFSLQFTMFRRIHILNKNGYDYATLEIPLHTQGEREEKLDDLKASTYNLANGKIEETKLGKADIFQDRKKKSEVIRKFTLPNVKEGSIIDYQFQITSDFLFNIRPWAFQSGIPKLWSEYRVELPQFMVYTLISQGNRAFDIYEHKDKTVTYSVEQNKDGPYGMSLGADRFNISCGLTQFRWAMKNVPAMKVEPYTSTIDNYVARLDFQLTELTEPYTAQKVMPDWPGLASYLLKEDDFGVQVNDALDWLTPIVNPIIQGAPTETDKAKKLFSFLRNQVTCTGHDNLVPEQPLKTTFKNGAGNVAEINLLLTAMLRAAGLNADPVILSTKQNGFVYTNYPVITKFNYVIARVMADGKEVLLDASYPNLGFAKLDANCYNGQARVVNNAATPIDLSSDQLSEGEMVSVQLLNDKNEGWVARVNDEQGYYGSLNIRRRIQKDGKENYFKDLGKEFTNDITIEKTGIDSLERYEEPITLHYDIKFGKEQPDIMYLDPILAEKYKKNPFKSADRQYPVEMPYKMNEVYLLTLNVPDGYVADEVPKPVTLKMDESNDVIFEYRISQSGGVISLRTRLQVNKTTFQPSQYNVLREFFNKVVRNRMSK